MKEHKHLWILKSKLPLDGQHWLAEFKCSHCPEKWQGVIARKKKITNYKLEKLI